MLRLWGWYRAISGYRKFAFVIDLALTEFVARPGGIRLGPIARIFLIRHFAIPLQYGDFVQFVLLLSI